MLKKIHFKKQYLLFIAFFIFGLIPLSSQRVEVFVSIIFSLLLGVYYYLIRKKKRTEINKTYLLNSLLFFVLLLTLHDGIDLKTFKKLEQMFSLLIFPVLFFLIAKADKSVLNEAFKIWKKVFVFATFIFSVICFLIFSNYTNPKYPNLDSNFFINAIQDSSYFSRHPIYVSLFLNIASLIVVDTFLKCKKNTKKLLYVFFFLIFSTLLFLLSTKMAILSLLISLIILLYFKLSKKVFFVSFISLIFLTFILIQNSPQKFNRFSKIFEKNVLIKNEKYNSIFIHKETILCSLKIFKENLFLGIGLENSNFHVNNCLRENFKYNPNIVYNSHNQYLSFGLHSGLIGFIMLIIILIDALKNSFKNHNLLFVFMLYFSIIFLTENVLERQTGIVLFAFILNIIPLFNTFTKTR